MHHRINYMYANFQQNRVSIRSVKTVHTNVFGKNLKVLEKCTKNLIGHSRLAFNNHESNIDC